MATDSTPVDSMASQGAFAIPPAGAISAWLESAANGGRLHLIVHWPITGSSNGQPTVFSRRTPPESTGILCAAFKIEGILLHEFNLDSASYLTRTGLK